MSNGLQKLENIILYLNANEPKGLYCEHIEVIKKELEALDLIRKKYIYWDIQYQPYEKHNDYRAWDSEAYYSVKLTKEEYDLLTEVLSNE